MRGKWNWWTSVRRESLASEANYDNITFFWHAKKSLNETVPPSQGLMADKPKQMQKAEKKKRILCFHSFMIFYFQFHLSVCITSWHRTSRPPSAAPFGDGFGGICQVSRSVGARHDARDRGKIQAHHVHEAVPGSSNNSSYEDQSSSFFHKDPRVEAQNSLREM